MTLPPITPGTPATPAPPAPAAPAPPKQGMSNGHKAFLIISGIVGGGLVLILGLAAILPRTTAGTSSGPGKVSIEGCSMSSARFAEAQLRVENTSSRSRTFIITVVFEDAGVQVGSALATVPDLQPGQVARDRAVGSVNDTNVTRCRVTSINTL